MSERRYKIEVTNAEELEKAFPQAIETVEIPARTEKKAKYSIVAKLLDCGIEVPGIKATKSAGSLQDDAETDTKEKGE